MERPDIIRPKSREEWLRCREAGIGSSEVATIVGLNPFETPYQLWRRKRGMDGPKEETFAMRAGHYLEDAVARFFSDETGAEVIKSSAGDWLAVSRERPYMRVSPDRTYWDAGARHSAGNKGILECKTTQRQVDRDDVPVHWFCQLQYQLGVAGVGHGSLAWLSAGREFGYRSFDFNPQFFAYLAGAVDRFWNENVVGGEEPASLSAADVLARCPRPEAGKSAEADGDLFAAYCALKKVRGEMDELNARREELEDRLKVGIGDAETLSYRGRTLATWKASKDAEKFDSGAFRAAYPSLAAEFTKAVPGARRFLLK